MMKRGDLDFALPGSPYPGLRPFTKDEWPIFFGREILAKEVMEGLIGKHFVAMHGESGCGKSSLVYAGVLPRLEQGHARGGAIWRTCTMRPENSPMRNLAKALADIEKPGADGNRILEFQRLLNLGGDALREVSRRIRQGRHDHVCILIDQFEELFDYAKEAGTEQARLFTDIIVGFEQKPPPGLHIILTMRSEFLGNCARYAGLAQSINNCQYLLPKMDRRALQRAIREPAALYDGSIDRELAERLIADAGASQDELPLIQHGLMRLHSRAIKGADGQSKSARWRLTLEDYEGSGGLGKMLSEHADDVLAESVKAQVKAGKNEDEARLTVERVFRAITNINADGFAVRRRQPFPELCAVTGTDPKLLDIALAPFRADGASFIRPYGNEPLADDDLIDISHEALIRCWRKIEFKQEGWLHDEFRDGLQWRTMLTQADRGDPLLRSAIEACDRFLQRHNEAWSRRYDDEKGNGWARVQKLLETSKTELNKSRLYFWAPISFAVFSVVVVFAIYVIQNQRNEATKRAKALAELQQTTARAAQLIDAGPPFNSAQLREINEALSLEETEEAPDEFKNVAKAIRSLWMNGIRSRRLTHRTESEFDQSAGTQKFDFNVHDLAVSADGKLRAAIGLEGRVGIWSKSDKHLRIKFKNGPANEYWQAHAINGRDSSHLNPQLLPNIRFISTTNKLVTTGIDNKLRISEFRHSEASNEISIIRSEVFDLGKALQAVKVSRDGRAALSAHLSFQPVDGAGRVNTDANLRLKYWSLLEPKRSRIFTVDIKKISSAEQVSQLAIGGTDNEIIAVSFENNRTAIWDTKESDRVNPAFAEEEPRHWEFQSNPLIVYTDGIPKGTLISGNGQHFFAANSSNVQMWNIEMASKQQSYNLPRSPIKTYSLSRHGHAMSIKELDSDTLIIGSTKGFLLWDHATSPMKDEDNINKEDNIDKYINKYGYSSNFDRISEIDYQMAGSNVRFGTGIANIAVDQPKNVIIGADPGGRMFELHRDTNRSVQTFDVHHIAEGKSPTVIAIAPDLNEAAVGNSDGTLEIFALDSPRATDEFGAFAPRYAAEPIVLIMGSAPVSAIVYDSTGKWLAVSTKTGNLMLLEKRGSDYKPWPKIDVAADIDTLIFADKEGDVEKEERIPRVVLGLSNGEIHVWDPKPLRDGQKSEPVYQIQQSPQPKKACSLTYNPKNNRISAVITDGSIISLDLGDLTTKHYNIVEHEKSEEKSAERVIFDAAFSPDHKIIVASYIDFPTQDTRPDILNIPCRNLTQNNSKPSENMIRRSPIPEEVEGNPFDLVFNKFDLVFNKIVKYLSASEETNSRDSPIPGAVTATFLPGRDRDQLAVVTWEGDVFFYDIKTQVIVHSLSLRGFGHYIPKHTDEDANKEQSGNAKAEQDATRIRPAISCKPAEERGTGDINCVTIVPQYNFPVIPPPGEKAYKKHTTLFFHRTTISGSD